MQVCITQVLVLLQIFLKVSGLYLSLKLERVASEHCLANTTQEQITPYFILCAYECGKSKNCIMLEYDNKTKVCRLSTTTDLQDCGSKSSSTEIYMMKKYEDPTNLTGQIGNHSQQASTITDNLTPWMASEQTKSPPSSTPEITSTTSMTSHTPTTEHKLLVNLAAGKNVSHARGTSATYALDGNMNSYYKSYRSGDENYFFIDLGATYTIIQFTIMPPTASAATDVDFRVTADGEDPVARLREAEDSCYYRGGVSPSLPENITCTRSMVGRYAGVFWVTGSQQLNGLSEISIYGY